MSFREQLGQVRREYRRDISQMAKRQEELDTKIDEGFAKMELRLQSVRDELSALVEDNRAIRSDILENSRTVTGRLRLTEERLGKMLDLVEQHMDQVDPAIISDLQRRMEAIEKKTNPAA